MSVALGAFLDSTELVPPITFEAAGPLMKGFDGLGVGTIENLSAITSHVDETDVAKHAKMLRHRRLCQSQCDDDVSNRTLLRGEVVEDVASARFRNGVEHIRRRRRPSHECNRIPIREYVKSGSTDPIYFQARRGRRDASLNATDHGVMSFTTTRIVDVPT